MMYVMVCVVDGIVGIKSEKSLFRSLRFHVMWVSTDARYIDTRPDTTLLQP